MTNQDYNKFDMMRWQTRRTLIAKTTRTTTMLLHRPDSGSRGKLLEAPSHTRSQTTPSQLQVLTEVIDSLPSFRSKREMEARVGNMTCVLRETKVLNKDNEIDIKSLK